MSYLMTTSPPECAHFKWKFSRRGMNITQHIMFKLQTTKPQQFKLETIKGMKLSLSSSEI